MVTGDDRADVTAVASHDGDATVVHEGDPPVGRVGRQLRLPAQPRDTAQSGTIALNREDLDGQAAYLAREGDAWPSVDQAGLKSE